MAEAFLRRYGNGQFEVHSAGLEPKGVNPFTIRVMDEAGIDISGHSSKGIETYLGKTHFQTLITVCDDADKNCPTVWPGVNTRLHWSFEDPAKVEGSEEQKLAKFRTVRDQIERRVKEWVAGQS
jgi:arsenate reductase